jgi:chromate reductase
MSDVVLLGLCGSLRKASLNHALLRALAGVMPAGARLEIYPSLDLPLFNSDLADPAAVTALKAAIAAADGVVFATPEYNYSVTGVTKNAIDWASRPPATAPLRGKPVGLVGAASGMSGSMRAQYHLRQMMVFSDAPTLAQPEVMIPRAHERFDAAGDLTDASTRELLGKFAVAMVAHAVRYRAR